MEQQPNAETKKRTMGFMLASELQWKLTPLCVCLALRGVAVLSECRAVTFECRGVQGAAYAVEDAPLRTRPHACAPQAKIAHTSHCYCTPIDPPPPPPSS